MVTITARQRILDLIGRRGAASASQIGHALNMSAATVRHHLSILAKDGRVAQEQPLARGRRGRPEKLYRLSDRMLGENFAGLSDALLDTWLQNLPESGRGAVLEAVGARLAQAAGRTDPGVSIARRLVQLIDRLNSRGYQAHWEAGAGGPHVLLAHCPYAAIIGRHPELCTIDSAFIADVAGSPVEQLARMQPQADGPKHCVFAMQQMPPSH